MATPVPVSSPVRSLSRPNLIAELRAFLAVARRELLIFIRYPTWVFAVLVWPLIFPAVYILTGRALAGPDGSGLAVFERLAGTSDFMGFIVIGTTIWMWQNIVLWEVGSALRQEQMRGTLETNWLSPTWRFSYLLASGASQFLTMLLFMIVAAFEFSLLLGVHFQAHLGVVLLVVLMSFPSIYGLAFAFASLVISAKEVSAFVYLVRGLVMVFCGITFPIALLPDWMQIVARWLPQSYIIHAMRAATLSGATLQALLPDLSALTGFGAFWLVTGYLMFKLMERRAQRNGTIGQY